MIHLKALKICIIMIKKCFKCGYDWLPRLTNPKACPRCNSRTWDQDRFIECKICKKHFVNIIIHHIDGNHKNDSSNNKILICQNCHLSIHMGIGRKNPGVQGGFGKRNNYGNWRGKKGQVETVKKLKFYQKQLK